MIPVGGVSTIDAVAATAIIRQLEPKIIIPMHYQTPLLKQELEPVDKFLKEIGVAEIEAQPKLSLTKSSLPPIPQVCLFTY